MLKREIKFEDFNGDSVKETHYFNLTKAEVIELELSAKGGLQQMITRIIAAGDHATLVTEFKKIILASIGKRSDDGKRFYKSDEITMDFQASGAFDALFFELATDEKAGADFCIGILPKDMAKGVKESKPDQDKPRRLPPSPPTR